MKLRCTACDQYAVKRGRADHWTCPECEQRVEVPTEETCQAVQAGEVIKEEFVVFDSCQDCMYFSCPAQPVDAEEKSVKDEMSSMFGDDEDAQAGFEEGWDPDKD